MLDENIRRAAADYGSEPAYQTPAGWTVSYTDLDRLSDEAAVGLRARGVTPGDVVALVLPSTLEYIVAYLATAKIGAITAGTNPRLRPAERTAVLESAAPALVLAAAGFTDGIPTDQRVEPISIADHSAGILAGLRVVGEAPPPLAQDPDRPICICFSSGSTGDPKGALFAYRQLAAIAELDTGGAWGGGGHRIAPTEFAHVGIMTKLPWLLAAGGTTHLLEKWRAEAIVDLIDTYRMGAVTGVAPQIALMLRVDGIDGRDFSCVNAIVVGGSASPPALVRRAREVFGAPYLIRYSSTESGGIGLGTAPDADDDEALHTVGKPRPGVEATVRDPDGQVVADGETGELWLRSPTVMSQYWRAPEATAATLVDGWLRTGDLATIDDRGLFRLTGRIKEMFIRGGYNVYPAEVETVLSDHPAISEIAIVPRSDDVMGEIGVAVCSAQPDAAAPTLDELRSFAADRLAGYKLPEAIRVLDQLPRNGTDKIDRRTLVEHEAAH